MTFLLLVLTIGVFAGIGIYNAINYIVDRIEWWRLARHMRQELARFRAEREAVERQYAATWRIR